VPALLLLGAAGTFAAYRHAVMANEYREQGGATHFFWHSVYTGLAFHPGLADEQKLAVDDLSVYLAAQQFVQAQGHQAEWLALGGTLPPQPITWQYLHYERYDQVVRDMFIHVCRERPGAVALTALYYKPRAFFSYAAWLMQLIDAPPTVAVLWHESDEQLAQMAVDMQVDGNFVKPWRWEVVAVLLALACWAGPSLIGHWRRVIGIAFLIFVFSLTPGVLGYPTPHTICDGLIVLIMTGFAAALVSVAWLATYLARVVRILPFTSLRPSCPVIQS
jgi:hypothetical protein